MHSTNTEDTPGKQFYNVHTKIVYRVLNIILSRIFLISFHANVYGGRRFKSFLLISILKL